MAAPEEDIRVLDLWHKGFSPAEIAKVLNIPLAAAYAKLKALERELVDAQGVKS